MGLRNQLQDLLAIQELSGGFAKSAQGMREQAGQQVLAQQAPGLIESGRIPEVLGLATAAGDTDLMRQVISAGLKKKDPTETPSLDLMKLKSAFPGVPESQLQPLVGLPAKDQLTAAGQIRGFESEERQSTETQRRMRQEVQGQRVKVGAKVDPAFKAIEEEERSLEKVREAMKKGTLPADAVVFNFLARNLAGEKGPLSDQDRAQFVSKAFAGDAQAFSNWLTGRSTSKMTDEQRAAFKELIGVATSNFEKYKQERLGSELTLAIADNPLLIGDDGKLDPSLEKRLERGGFQYQDGKLVAKNVQKKQVPLTPETPVQDVIGTIKDEKTKRQMTEALQAFQQANPGKPISRDFTNAAIEAAKKGN